MTITGIEAATQGIEKAVLITSQHKKMMELQGEMIVELINSSKVPGPSDLLEIPGMGGRLDIHA